MNDSSNKTVSLNVQADATSIYEGGNLLPVSIKDLEGNEVALRQLVNTLNLSHKDNRDLRSEITTLRIKVASYSLQPLVAIILSVTNIAGAVLIGFGINYLSSSAPPPSSGWILGVGIALTVIGAIVPPFMPFIVKNIRSIENAN